MENNITDKGWKAMRELLDREMPEKRRRRFGWWWFALVLLPVAVYGSWQWMNTAKDSPKTLPAEPVASLAPRPESAGIIQIPEKTKPLSAGHEITGAATGSEVSSGVAAKSKKRKPVRTALVLTAFPANDPRISPPQIVVNPNPMTPADLDISTPQQGTHAKSLVSTTALPISAQNIDFKSSASFSPHLFNLSEPVKTVKKSDHKRWAFGATNAISTEQFNHINGFSTGATVDWNFARKWGLRTGILYNIHHPQEKYKPVASVGSESYGSSVEGYVIIKDLITGYELVNIPGNNTYADSLDGKVFIPVNRLQRLEVPLTVFWQAARPLKIFGGLSFTRTLSAKADRQNYSGDYILKLGDRRAADGASKLSSSELDNWSADAMLGAGLRIAKIFELGVSAKMPLKQLPSIEDIDQAGQGINPSIAEKSLNSSHKPNSFVFSLYGTLFF